MMREKATWRHRRATRMECDEITPDLAATRGSVAELGRRQQRHAEQCLRCQAELAQHRKLARSLEGLRTERMEPPGEFVADVMAALDGEEPDPARPVLSARRVAYAGGLAAATAAGAVSALVFTARSRRTRLVG